MRTSRKLNFLMLSFLLGAWAPTASATNYYVSTTGNDSNSGISPSEAWRHIQYAASGAGGQVRPGDTVYIKAGNYGNEYVVIRISGSEGKPIVFEGYRSSPGDNPKLNYKPGNELDPDVMPLLNGQDRTGIGIEINGKSYVEIRNIQITLYDTGVSMYSCSYVTLDNIIGIRFGIYYGIAFGMTRSTRCIVRNCIATDGTGDNFGMHGTYNLIENCKSYGVEGNTIDEATDYYLYVWGSNNTVRNCLAHRTRDLPHQGHGIGAHTPSDAVEGDSSYYSYNNKFIDCTAINLSENFYVRHSGVHHNEFINCTAYDFYGFAIRDGAHDNTFRNCRAIGTRSGVHFYDSSEDGAKGCGFNNTFANCIFENSGSVIYFWKYVYSTPADNNVFMNCVMKGSNYLFTSQIPNSNNKMVNCTLTDILEYKKGPENVGMMFTYCDFWNNGFSTPSGIGNIETDPLFVDAANGDYHLRAGSPCIDAGTDVGLTQDFEGNPVPQGKAPDIGVYEYVFFPVSVIKNEPKEGHLPLTVSFDGSQSTSFNGDIVSYEWDFGDGSTSTGMKTSHTFTSAGEYTVTLTVTDALGLKGESQTRIIVFEKEFKELPAGCYNNVFNPTKGEKALIVVELPKQAQVKLNLYDSRGNRIRELADEEKEPGTHKYYWDGKDDSGNVVGSGLYFTHILAGDYRKTKKIVVLK